MPALPLIVFDVNETLVDLRTMEPTFKRVFGDKADMQLWFANLVMYSLALTLAHSHVPFTDIGSAVMKMLADTQGIDINTPTGESSRRNSRPCRLIWKCRARCRRCAMRVSGCLPSPTIWLKFRPVSSSKEASTAPMVGQSAKEKFRA
jgi:2-haloacid dehalogenase